jgi:tetratricopeptide (TPR) repeat protein
VNKDRPVYLAVTVPEQMGLEEHLVMEGLVFRVVPEKGEAERVDIDRTWENLRNVFVYRSLLTDEGYFDDSVYKDQNSRKLVQNYVAAYVRVAHAHLRAGNDDKALEALEYARRINPGFPGVLYTQGYLMLEQERFGEAETAFRALIEVGDRAPEVYRFLGAALEAQENYSEAEEVYFEAIRANPEDFDSHRVLFTYLWSVGKQEEAVRLIERWLAQHPDDELTRQALEELLGSEAAPESTR